MAAVLWESKCINSKSEAMKIKARYQLNKDAKVGEQCICPSCNTTFTKESYQQAFCKTKGGTICKDKYWNTVDPKKRNNTTRISPANAAYQAMQIEERGITFVDHDKDTVTISDGQYSYIKLK